MQPYNIVIMEMLPGSTPKEKYENLKKIGSILQTTAFPKRGTPEESLTIQDIADLIQNFFSLKEIEKLSGEK